MVYLPLCLLLKDNTRKFWKECYKCDKFSLRKVDVQQSSIIGITQIRCFYRFIVNLRFASAASFAPVTLSCIRYPAVPVCKKCAKMCRAKIGPLKQALSFYAKPGNSRVRAQNGSGNLACLDQASNVHQQLRFMAGIWI